MAEASEIPDGFAAIARIVGAWGVRGEVKAEPMAPADVLTTGRAVLLAGRETTLERVAFADRYVRIKLAGISDREAAADLAGRYVLVDAENLPSLPEDQYYRFQILGLRVVSSEGEELGTVEDVFSTRENDVYVVRGAEREILLPATDDVVLDIDLESRTMTVEVIPGLLP
jgi:16S rRNA processing protein RimM